MIMLLAHHEAAFNPIVIASAISAVAFVWRFGKLLWTPDPTTKNQKSEA